jgi:hypothetical protein
MQTSKRVVPNTGSPNADTATSDRNALNPSFSRSRPTTSLMATLAAAGTTQSVRGVAGHSPAAVAALASVTPAAINRAMAVTRRVRRTITPSP